MMRRIALLMVAGIIFAGCADSNPSPSGASSSVEGGLPAGPSPNWDNPIEGTKVASVEEAAPNLSFVPYEPHGLGTPSEIFVTPEEFAKSTREIAFIFDSVDFGRVVVIERPTPISADAWEEWIADLVAENGSPTLSGSFTAVTVRNGFPALLTTSGDGVRNTVRWLDGDVQFIVDGPALEASDAQEVVDLI